MRALGTLVLADVPRRDFVQKYARSNVSRDMAEDILTLGPGAG